MAAAAPRHDSQLPLARIGFLLEQTLGHRSHAANLQRALPNIRTIQADVRPIDFGTADAFASVPGYSNWTVRAAIRTARELRRLHRETAVDGLFFHTQVLTTLAGRWMKRIPSIVSLDATPRQYDEMGITYVHRIRSPVIEAAKLRLNRRAFDLAARLVAWSKWCRDSLVDDYAVDPEKISVIPPGVDRPLWTRPPEHRDDGAVRILFVGSDFERKGGPLLLEAFRRVQQLVAAERPDMTIELDVVTTADVRQEPGVRVHRGVQANSPRLVTLYHKASIFCLPTLGDCLPMVLSEAGAAGLPVVATTIGAISEIVRHDDSGLLVPSGDVDALTAALHRLIREPELRRRMGARGERIVGERFDADANAAKLADLLVSVVCSDAR